MTRLIIIVVHVMTLHAQYWSIHEQQAVLPNQLTVKVDYFNKLLRMHTHCKTVQSAVTPQFFVYGKQ